MTVALIACSNGFGHTKRLLLLANELNNLSINSVIYAPIESVKHISRTHKIPIHTVKDFDSKTSISDWLTGNAANWYKSLPDLSSYDQVVSDNLVEILKIRPDAWLSGSFFWHNSLKGIPDNIITRTNEILSNNHPRMISSALFSSDYLKKNTKLYEVGVYANNDVLSSKLSYLHKSDVLISIGHGLNLYKEAHKFINYISEKKDIGFDNVWVEPCLIPKNPPNWMKVATYTAEMYEKIAVSIIRPGVGTITDTLIYGGRPLMFHEHENQEMKRNSSTINKLGLGESCSSIKDAWQKAEDYISNKKMQEKHINLVRNLDRNGAMQAASILKLHK